MSMIRMPKRYLVSDHRRVPHVSADPDFAQEFAEATRKTFEPVTPCGSRERAAGWWWLVAGVVTATVFIAVAIVTRRS